MKNRILTLTLTAALGLSFGIPALCGEKEQGAPTAAQLSGNLYAYPWIEEAPAQTPAPEGYRPFHLEHYGRHGSRWLIGENDYLTPVHKLEKAEKAGKLTPLGEKVLATLREMAKGSGGRLGELTDKGAEQHKAIGRRMASNFPAIFNGTADVDAKSTVVIRCILSMANGLEGIQEVAPDVEPRKDASYADMWFMNYDDKPAWVIKDRGDMEYVGPYRNRHLGSGEYLNRLVTDPKFAQDSVAPGIMPYFYWVLASMQGHEGKEWLLEEVFSKEELQELWRGGNAYWFIHSGNTPMTDYRMPYTQRKLLGRIIEQTDSAIASPRPSARLRYGHDGILVNLVTLMELGNYGDEVTDLEQLEEMGWHDYEIIPMAGNLQLIFYRKDGSKGEDDILVKAMLNEREIALPGEAVTGPYYRWKDLKRYYKKKLEDFEKGDKN